MVMLALTLQLLGPPAPAELHLVPPLQLAAAPDLAARAPPAMAPGREPAPDPYAGSSRGGEWAAGSLGVLAAEFASVVLAAAIVSSAGQNSEGFPRISERPALAWLLFVTLAIPGGAALGADLAANAEAGGSFGRAFGFALLAELAGVAACIPAFALSPVLGLAVVLGWQFGVIPWAASRGMHPAAEPEVDAGWSRDPRGGLPAGTLTWRF